MCQPFERITKYNFFICNILHDIYVFLVIKNAKLFTFCIVTYRKEYTLQKKLYVPALQMFNI